MYKFPQKMLEVDWQERACSKPMLKSVSSKQVLNDVEKTGSQKNSRWYEQLQGISIWEFTSRQ